MAVTKNDVAKLYLAFFHRAPEGDGLNNWYQLAQNNNWDYATLAEKMLESAKAIVNASPQYAAKYPHYATLQQDDIVSIKSVITEVYKALFNKNYVDDAKGIDDWAQYALTHGIGKTIALITNVGEMIANGTIPADQKTVEHAKAFLNKVQVALSSATTIPVADLDNDGNYDFDEFKTLIQNVDDTQQSIDDALTYLSSLSNVYHNSHFGNTGATVNKIDGTAGDDRLTGTDLADEIHGLEGNDIIRGGKGVDKVYAGDGDDKIVIVGDLTGGGKLDTPEDTAILGTQLSSYNGIDFNEDENGSAELIDGGNGNDTLYIYGTADISNDQITGIEHIEIRSDVTFNADLLTKIETLNGDGKSTVRIVNPTNQPITVDLTAIKLDNVGKIEVDEGVTLEIESLDDLGGAHILMGKGTIVGKPGSAFALDNTYTIEPTLQIKSDGGKLDAKGSAVVVNNIITGTVGWIEGSDGDDYLIGSDNDDILISKAGNDIMVGQNGTDTYIVNGTGKKVIIEGAKDNKGVGDTLDLSQAPTNTGANIDLATGGDVGQNIQIQLGANNTEGALIVPKFNIMLILDVSGSMDWSTPDGTARRIDKEIEAAKKLLDEYDKLGDIAVKLVLFDDEIENQAFNYSSAWIDANSAKQIIDSLSPLGGTYYDTALQEAMDTFQRLPNNTYYLDGANRVFFLSDGEPNWGHEVTQTLQNEWENFLITHDIKSYALGFGGISNLTYLEPIAFDGTKVYDVNDDHAPGQIPATIETDINKLGETLVNQAKVDFMENVVGTAYDDTLTGNTLNNTIKGGDGNDTLAGRMGTDLLLGGKGSDTVVIAPEKYKDVIDTFVDPEAGDKIKWESFNGTETFQGQVQWQGDLATTLQLAAQNDGSQNSVIVWFTDGTDSYLFVDNSAQAEYDPYNDEIIKLSNYTNLANATLDTVEHTLTLA